jgi:hypothetical protein
VLNEASPPVRSVTISRSSSASTVSHLGLIRLEIKLKLLLSDTFSWMPLNSFSPWKRKSTVPRLYKCRDKQSSATSAARLRPLVPRDSASRPSRDQVATLDLHSRHIDCEIERVRYSERQRTPTHMATNSQTYRRANLTDIEIDYGRGTIST